MSQSGRPPDRWTDAGWSRVPGDAAAIFWRESLRYRRDRAYWVGQLAFPLLAVGFIGFGLDGVVQLTDETAYSAFLASGLLALLAGSGAVGAGFSLIQDRDSGFLRALCVAPVSATGVVLGKVAARWVVTLILVAALTAVFAAATPLSLPHPGAALLAVTGITALFTALGVGLAAWLHSAESFRLLAGLVTIPLYLLSGVLYPVETLPAPSRALALVNPLSYGVDLLRYGLLGTHEFAPQQSSLGLLLLTALCLPLAVWAYRTGTER